MPTQIFSCIKLSRIKLFETKFGTMVHMIQCTQIRCNCLVIKIHNTNFFFFK